MVYKAVALSTKQQLLRYGYIGQEKDGKLYNYRARMYDSKLRRFLSADKAKQQWGAYAYVDDNPVSFIDRDGNMKEIFLSAEDYGGSQEEIILMYKRLQEVDKLIQAIKIKVPYSANMAEHILQTGGEIMIRYNYLNYFEKYLKFTHKIHLYAEMPHALAAIIEKLGVAVCDEYQRVGFSAAIKYFGKQMQANSNLWNNYYINRVRFLDPSLGHRYLRFDYYNPDGSLNPYKTIVFDLWVLEPQAIRLQEGSYQSNHEIDGKQFRYNTHSILSEWLEQERQSEIILNPTIPALKKFLSTIQSDNISLIYKTSEETNYKNIMNKEPVMSSLKFQTAYNKLAKLNNRSQEQLNVKTQSYLYDWVTAAANASGDNANGIYSGERTASIFEDEMIKYIPYKHKKGSKSVDFNSCKDKSEFD